MKDLAANLLLRAAGSWYGLHMTRTNLPTACTMCKKRLSSRNRASAQVGMLPGTYDDLCVSCYEEDPTEDFAPDVTDAPSASTGRRNRSHLNCAHARTSAARAICRRTS